MVFFVSVACLYNAEICWCWIYKSSKWLVLLWCMAKLKWNAHNWVSHSLKLSFNNFSLSVINFAYPSSRFFFEYTSPLNENEWKVMATVLKNEFGETCYMSCGLLKSKSTILQQFQGNAGKYSFEVIFRYSLIVLIGFYPLSLLLKNCTTKSKKLFFFHHLYSIF